MERQVLGRKDYAQEELDQATRAVKQQLAAYKKLVKALTHAGDDPEVAAALDTWVWIRLLDGLGY